VDRGTQIWPTQKFSRGDHYEGDCSPNTDTSLTKVKQINPHAVVLIEYLY